MRFAALLMAVALVGGPVINADAARAATLPDTLPQLVERASAHLEKLADENDTIWLRSRSRKSDFDLRKGTIRWHFDNGFSVARVELLGVWSPSDNSFLWGWSHPMAPRGTAVSSQKMRRFAEERGIVELTKPQTTCDATTCEALAGIAVLLGGLRGLHRAQLRPGGAWLYLGFGRVRQRRTFDK